MLTVLVAAICIVALVYYTKKPPVPPVVETSQVYGLNPAAAYEPADPRLQLLSRRLKEIADDRLMADTLEDLGAKAKPARTAPSVSP